MSMRISSVLNAYDVHAAQKSAPTQRMTRAQEKKDIVAISSHAKDYQTVVKALHDVADIRQDRVSEIQSRIESGNYQVSSKDVADKIIDLI